jgi:AraC-like DNA-binding protein
MLRNLGKPLRVSTLSSMAGYSSSHFLTLFKSSTGYAPKEFFIRLRMHRACLMLARAARVKEVAAALGYDDQFYFSRLFKSVLGIAPRDYRQKMSSTTGSRRRLLQVAGTRERTAAFKVPSWIQLA